MNTKKRTLSSSDSSSEPDEAERFLNKRVRCEKLDEVGQNSRSSHSTIYKMNKSTSEKPTRQRRYRKKQKKADPKLQQQVTDLKNQNRELSLLLEQYMKIIDQLKESAEISENTTANNEISKTGGFQNESN